MDKLREFWSSFLNLAIMGDADTVTGFILTGIGGKNRDGQTNFLVVNKDTDQATIEAKFKELTSRKDIGIVIITQNVAEMIRHLLNQYEKQTPTILEIPAKDQEYNADKDPVMTRVKRLLGKA